jgi:hypothetical protein
MSDNVANEINEYGCSVSVIGELLDGRTCDEFVYAQLLVAEEQMLRGLIRSSQQTMNRIKWVLKSQRGVSPMVETDIDGMSAESVSMEPCALSNTSEAFESLVLRATRVKHSRYLFETYKDGSDIVVVDTLHDTVSILTATEAESLICQVCRNQTKGFTQCAG